MGKMKKEKAAKPVYEYFVDPERKILIRLSMFEAEQYCPGARKVWQANPALEGIRTGSGDFDYFERITAKEAREYAARFRAEKAGK